MSYLKFFLPTRPTEKEMFQSKLNAAIKLIRENQSIVAVKSLEVIDAGDVTIHSFFDMSYEHYLDMMDDMEERQIELPSHFPPSVSAVRQIEQHLDGIIYNNKTIYLNSQKSIAQIASTLIHEVCHFSNTSIFETEHLTQNFKRASYNDEVRSFIAEKTFERNGHCLRRSDIKNIHATVTELYPSFVTTTEEKPGYLFSHYDTPS